MTTIQDAVPREPGSLEELKSFIAILAYFAKPQVSGASKRLGAAAREIELRLEKLAADRERVLSDREIAVADRERAAELFAQELAGRERALAAREHQFHTLFAAAEEVLAS